MTNDRVLIICSHVYVMYSALSSPHVRFAERKMRVRSIDSIVRVFQMTEREIDCLFSSSYPSEKGKSDQQIGRAHV